MAAGANRGSGAPDVAGWRHQTLGGGIFGATLWLLILTAMVKDWVFFSIVVGSDVLLWFGLTRVLARRPQWSWSIVVVMVGALMTLTLAVVNLRWNLWMETYRASPAYQAVNDVGLRTINLVIAGSYSVLILLGIWRYTRARHET